MAIAVTRNLLSLCRNHRSHKNANDAIVDLYEDVRTDRRYRRCIKPALFHLIAAHYMKNEALTKHLIKVNQCGMLGAIH